jgi:ATP-dependent helicase/nuclease subunit A
MEAGAQLRIEWSADDGPADIGSADDGGLRREADPARAADTAKALALTDEQEQPVARRSESLLLSAAAGSGKTSVLVERFVRAVREDSLAPGKVLAITFTDRAAGELRARMRSRLLELGEREAARETETAFVGTFHGFCARLLRAHALTAGLEPEFAILEEGIAERLRGEAFAVALRGFVQEERTDAVDLLAAYGAERVQRMIAAVHAQLRSRGERLPRLPAPTPSPMPRLWSGSTVGETGRDDAQATAACVLLDELLAEFGHAYERLKRERGAVDFDDLELFALELLEEHENVRTSWSERFELLMVDEFQDTNPRQLRILRALERGNLFTVGDEHQSIYGFRHADVQLFRDRRAELERHGGCLALTRNFRSRAPLLNVLNTVFAERMPAFTPLVAARRDAREDDPVAAHPDPQAAKPLVELLLSARTGWEGALPEQLADGLPAAPTWRHAEARMLARRVHSMVHEEGVQPGEVVVLLRALGDVEVYERALQMRGLRTLAMVGAFWEHQQVGDLLAYLRALANPLDEQALYATLASPLLGLSRDGLALLARASRMSGRSVWETALGGGEEGTPEGMSDDERRALTDFCARMREERASASRRTIAELIERALRAGYREHVLGLPSGEHRLANVYKLQRLARRFEASEGRDLRAFLDHAEHLAGAGGGEPNAPVGAGEPGAVRLMSIHAAKGLEFPVVCVADLGRAPNTRMPDLLVDGARMGLQLVRLDGAKATPTLDFERLAEERIRAEAEEEDRIMYVAMTRARERLLLSGAIDLERWAEPRMPATAISWLGPALAGELPMLAKAAGTPEQVHDLPLGGFADAHVRVRLSSPAGLAGTLDRDAPTTGPSAAREQTGVEDPSTPVGGPTNGARAVRDIGSPAHGATAVPDVATLSYTALSELERCGYRFYLERVLGLGEERAPGAAGPGAGAGLDARSRGTLVHRLLEGFDFARAQAPSPAQVARVARELGLRTSEGERKEIAALLEAAGRSAPAARVARAEHLRREHSFAFSLAADEPTPAGGAGGELITGVIDLLAREQGGGMLVIDYKSDRVEGGELDLGALVERDYGVQRLIYALAVLRGGAASVEIVHWFLERPGDPVGAGFTADDREALEAQLAERLRRVREDPFRVSAAPHRGLCLTCPGRAGLCSWDDEHTLRAEPGN